MAGAAILLLAAFLVGGRFFPGLSLTGSANQAKDIETFRQLRYRGWLISWYITSLIPFGVASMSIWWHLSRWRRWRWSVRRACQSGLIGMTILGYGFAFVAYRGLNRELVEGTSAFIGLAFMAIPFYVFGSLLLGYGVGWFVGAIRAASEQDRNAQLKPFCERCNYSLRDHQGSRCPECGTLIATANIEESQKGKQ